MHLVQCLALVGLQVASFPFCKPVTISSAFSFLTSSGRVTCMLSCNRTNLSLTLLHSCFSLGDHLSSRSLESPQLPVFVMILLIYLVLRPARTFSFVLRILPCSHSRSLHGHSKSLALCSSYSHFHLSTDYFVTHRHQTSRLWTQTTTTCTASNSSPSALLPLRRWQLPNPSLFSLRLPLPLLLQVSLLLSSTPRQT